jgi:hypothetical protein
MNRKGTSDSRLFGEKYNAVGGKKTKAQNREDKKKKTMLVSGKSVFGIKDIITKKSPISKQK